jgi:hypothetical protein
MSHPFAGRGALAREKGEQGLVIYPDVQGRFFFRTSSDFTDQDNSLGFGVCLKFFKIAVKEKPTIRSPPSPLTVDCPSPALDSCR